MYSSLPRRRLNAAINAFWAAAAIGAASAFGADTQDATAQPSSEASLAQQIFDTMSRAPGIKAGFRPVHAKGVVCKGTFEPSADASALSKAAHFQGAAVPLTIRFSDGASDPSIPDSSPNAGPRGMAIRFHLPDGTTTDIVSMSHNGFIVGTGEDFLALQQAIVGTDPGKPHPWPIEAFLASHPLAAKFVQEIQSTPSSFGTESFFSNDAFVFVNQAGVRQPGRYKILPAAGLHHLSNAEAATKSPDFLVSELAARLRSAPVVYDVIVQIPNAGDPTHDPSLVWPDDRRTVRIGTINISSVVKDSDAAQRALAFFPTSLADGIELSDDPLPALRTSVYGLSVAHRQQQ